jgi:MgtE intracellular N domain
MKRVLMLAIIALVAGLGGGTGWSVIRAPAAKPAAVTADSAAADSAAADSATADSAAAGPPAVVTPVAPVGKPAAAHVAQAAHGDSSARAGRGRASKPACAPAAADTGPARRHAAVRAAPPPTPAVRQTVKAGIMTATIPGGAASRVDTARVGQLARLFAAMPARDAARVLLELDQSDAQVVLSAMDNRHAAEILSNFPPDRAADMSKLVLHAPRP